MRTLTMNSSKGEHEADSAINTQSTMNTIIYDGEAPKMIHKAVPTLMKGNILVKIHAAGVNPVDAKKVFGDKLPNYGPFQSFLKYAVRSCCPGFDFSGVVHQVPTGEECPYRIGDKVFGTVPPFTGTFCEYQNVPLDQVHYMPSTLTFVQAAAVPLTGLTCLQSFALGSVDSNSHVLVIGASGGTGHFAVQYAKRYLNVKRVVGICGTRNVEWAKELGADHVIDYKDEKWQEHIKQEVEVHGPFTCVLDTVFSNQAHDQSTGYETFLRSFDGGHKLVEGMYLRLGGNPNSWCAAGLKRVLGINLFGKDSELFWVRFPRSSEELRTLKLAVDEHNVKPYISEALSFNEENVARAFELLKGRRTRGKIVLRLIDEVGNENSEENSLIH